MPTLPQQPQLDRHQALQININSEDDAKAVIQHLPQIKRTWQMLADTSGVSAVEFCIAEYIRNKVENILIGAIPWCRTYVKSVKPFDGNVHFPLPHYVPPAVNVTKTEDSAKQPAPKRNRYLPNGDPTPLPMPAEQTAPPASDVDRRQAALNERALAALDQTPGKSQRPVSADKPGT